MSAPAIHAKAIDLGKLSLRMTTAAGAGHPSSALSLAHLIAELMYRRMRWDPADPWHASADRLVLSEGHAVPIVYAALADLGATVGRERSSAQALTRSELDALRALDSVLDGHPNPAEGVPFFDAATGSLGMGLSVAAGLALAARLDGSPRRVYCIVGDGESREGQIWEAVDFIADHKLTNVCAIFNANGYGQAAHVSAQQSAERLVAKLAAFGWQTVSIDGHNPDEIAAALAKCDAAQQPLAIVARTVKGWGVDSMLTGANWHGKPASEKELPEAIASLDRMAAKLGASGGGGSLGGQSGATAHPLIAGATPHPLIAGATLAGATLAGATPAGPAVRERPDPREVHWPTFEEGLRGVGLGGALDKKAVGTRRAYGAALKVAGDLLPQVVCLDADVSNSTFAEFFAKAHPQRFFECKIAEQNMISTAAGLAAAGFIPFANSFAKFIGRAYDQVELAAISRANVKIVGSHSGATPSSDGPSQMALLDAAFFHGLSSVRGDDRVGPVCWFYQPADAVAAWHLTRQMVAQRGLCYMRTHRPEVPLLYPPDAAFEPGGLNVLQTGDELALIGSGYTVHVAREAAALLARQNRRTAVIDLYCLPLNHEKLVEALQRAGRRALVVEDNYGGGFGSAVAEAAARAGGLRVRTLTLQRIPKSAREPAELLDYCGVGVGQVADQALALLTT